MLCEVNGLYVVSGVELLRVLDEKEKDETLPEAIRRILCPAAEKVELAGTQFKTVPHETRERTAARTCATGRPDQWVPCIRCWRNIMKQVFQNRGRFCYVCGTREHIEGHHIIPRLDGGNHDWTNIVPLCTTCHNFVECHDKRPRTLDDILRVGLERLA